MTRYLLDANVVLRFLRDDHRTLSRRASALFESAAAGDCTIVLPAVVLAECVWVLRSFYDESHERVANVLTALVTSPGIAADEPEVTVDALARMAAHRLDYADCYLAARAARSDEPIASFDRDLDRFDDVRRWIAPD